MKKTLKEAMAAASGRSPMSVAKPQANKARTEQGLVLIGSHWPPDVRRTLKLLEYKTGKNLRQLQGEAINDLCAKYQVPEPCTVEE
jgi:hypothetical protein